MFAAVASKTSRADKSSSRSAPWRSPFVVNGRFYSQRLTGVQRYAREVIRAMDSLLAAADGVGRIVAPAGTPGPSDLSAFELSEVKPFSGHLWEQTALPVHGKAPVLSLCNTGPLAVSDQVVCIHDANVFVQPESYSKSFVALYRMLLPRLARRVRRVSTVSGVSARQLSDVLRIPMRDILVLPNGHEHAFRWNADRSRLDATNEFRRPFVLMLGSRARHKNMGLILGLAEALDEIGLDIVVAGGGDGIFSHSDHRSAPNVKELGHVTDDDLALLYGRALCLTFPSLAEGFGLPLVEAMALGCPVISSDQSSMPQVCGEAALLAPPTDASKWLSHIRAVASSKDLQSDLRGRGFEQVKKFSWTASARGYLDLFGITA